MTTLLTPHRLFQRAPRALLSGVVATVLLLAAPNTIDGVLTALLIVNAAALTGWSIIQLLSVNAGQPGCLHTGAKGAGGSHDKIKSHHTDSPEFVSVHVPTHAEPPEVVITTLKALARQEYPHFEVIVVDNNTHDARLWKPVAALCDTLGPRFHFVRRMGVTGAKAGALDIARQLSSARASHVAIVDADYEVEPSFLTRAMQTLQRERKDFVQFPQAYRDVNRSSAGLEAELGDYFSRVAIDADRAGAMLLTGTLSVVSLAALDRAGGWRAQSVTEDAELGLRLYQSCYGGRFIGEVAGPRTNRPVSPVSRCSPALLQAYR